MDPQSRITVVCGKGGVGKTTVSLALGLKHANRGHRVVIVSSHPLPELAIAVSLEGIAARFPIAARNLFVVHLDPKELLQEIVEENFPMQMVAQAILNSSIFKNLVEVAPGLKEFYFLARLQELAERKATAAGADGPDYEVLIWDAPASGHFLSTLRAARAFETFLSGPLASAGAEMDRFFSNSANMQILAVTPLEEMAITETIEMAESLKRDFQLRCSALILNLVSPLVTANEEEIAGIAIDDESSPALRFAVDRGTLERERSVDIRKNIPAPQICVPRIREWTSDLDLLGKVSEWLNLPKSA
ncbi:MAG TPA: ArsA-related P-loop ATPase [Bryobacteraceae bacterium]|nr:ArsA-related P-loop ATPase [Bryobacteraceae bacterium]